MRYLPLILVCLLAASVMPSDKTPSFKSFVVGNIYQNDNMTLANGKWYADRYDFVLNQRSSVPIHDSMMKYNPDIEAAYYTDAHMTGNVEGSSDWTYSCLMRFYDSASISAESAFVHIAESIVVHSLSDDADRWINLDSLASAGNDSATRVSLRYFYNDINDTANMGSGYYPAGDGEWYCNVTSPTFRSFRAASYLYMWERQDELLPNLDSVVNYAYLDNYLLTYQESVSNYWLSDGTRHIDSSIDYGGAWKTATAEVDWDIQDDIVPNDIILRTPLMQLAGEIQDSMAAGGYGGVIPNMNNTTIAALFDFVDGYEPAGLFYENRGEKIVKSPYNDGGEGFWQYSRKHDTVLLANSATMQFWEYRLWASNGDDDTSTADADRYFLMALNSFLCMQDTATDYFKFGLADMDFWFTGHEIDLGYPIGEYDSLTYNSGDDFVFFRRYSKGFSVFRPEMTNYTSVTFTHDSLGLGDTTLYQIGAWLSDTVATIAYLDGIAIDTIEGQYFLFESGESGPGVSGLSSSKDTIAVQTTITATCTDDYGIDSVDLFIYLPDSTAWVNDSVSILDTLLGADETTYNLSETYTWGQTGGHWIYLTLVDDSSNAKVGSLYVDVQAAASGSSPTNQVIEKITLQGVTIE